MATNFYDASHLPKANYPVDIEKSKEETLVRLAHKLVGNSRASDTVSLNAADGSSPFIYFGEKGKGIDYYAAYSYISENIKPVIERVIEHRLEGYSIGASKIESDAALLAKDEVKKSLPNFFRELTKEEEEIIKMRTAEIKAGLKESPEYNADNLMSVVEGIISRHKGTVRSK